MNEALGGVRLTEQGVLPFASTQSLDLSEADLLSAALGWSGLTAAVSLYPARCCCSPIMKHLGYREGGVPSH